MGTHPIFESDFDCLTEIMPKICIQSPEVAMQGEIAISARVNIVTKAKLDEITVQGSCGCDGPPPPPPEKKTDLDIVFLVDGSDSFDASKIGEEWRSGRENSGLKVHRTQFQESMKWCGDFVNSLNSRRIGRTSATVVQFSGFKKLEESYIPDNDGNAFEDDDSLKHYQVEYGPKLVTGEDSDLTKLDTVESLDGNSQLFLALQDMSSDKFKERLNEVLPLSTDENVQRRRILIIITDEEWDVRKLKASDNVRLNSESGTLNTSISSEADLEEEETVRSARRSVSAHPEKRISRVERSVVPHYAHSVYDEMFTIIVRPDSKVTHLNEEFVKTALCKGKEQNYFKAYANDFYERMESAQKKIMNVIDRW